MHAHLNVPRDISPGAGLRQHHLRQQSRLRSPGAYLKIMSVGHVRSDHNKLFIKHDPDSIE